MGRPKKSEISKIISFRVNADIVDFFKSFDNSNAFFVELVENCEEYKLFLQKKKYSADEPNLFDDFS